MDDSDESLGYDYEDDDNATIINLLFHRSSAFIYIYDSFVRLF